MTHHPDFKDTDFTIDVCRDWNFLVKRFAFHSSSSKETMRSEYLVTLVLEPSPGIYFPKVVESIASLVDPNGKVTPFRKTITQFKVVTVNKPIATDVFTLPLPEGVAVVDERDKTTYLIDAKGKPTNVAHSYPQSFETPATATYESPSTGTFSYWLYVAIGLAVVYVALHVYRRWRKA